MRECLFLRTLPPCCQRYLTHCSARTIDRSYNNLKAKKETIFYSLQPQSQKANPEDSKHTPQLKAVNYGEEATRPSSKLLWYCHVAFIFRIGVSLTAGRCSKLPPSPAAHSSLPSSSLLMFSQSYFVLMSSSPCLPIRFRNISSS